MAIPNLTTLLHDLIAAPSVSSTLADLDQSNAQVITVLAGWLEELGFTVETCPIANRPGKFNLIATRGQGPDGLVLAGHTDTVPCEPALWTSDPFQLTERNGKFYGLGTSDMKGFFALVIEALRNLDLHNIQRPLIILATADEESSMSGVQALLESGRKFGRHALYSAREELSGSYMHQCLGL